MTGQEIRRGDIFYINNNRGQSGCEIKKDRPAIIVSADFLNKNSDVVVVVFLTSQPKKDMQTHVTVRSTGRVSEALCEQPTSVSVEKLNNYIGRATRSEMQRIDIALQAAMQIGIDREEKRTGGKRNAESMDSGNNQQSDRRDRHAASGGRDHSHRGTAGRRRVRADQDGRDGHRETGKRRKAE